MVERELSPNSEQGNVKTLLFVVFLSVQAHAVVSVWNNLNDADDPWNQGLVEEAPEAVHSVASFDS